APGRTLIVAFERRPRARIAADIAGADAGDDRRAAVTRFVHHRLQVVIVDHVAADQPVAREVAGGALRDDAARAAVGGPAQRVVDAADRLRGPVGLRREQGE